MNAKLYFLFIRYNNRRPWKPSAPCKASVNPWYKQAQLSKLKFRSRSLILILCNVYSSKSMYCTSMYIHTFYFYDTPYKQKWSFSFLINFYIYDKSDRLSPRWTKPWKVHLDTKISIFLEAYDKLIIKLIIICTYGSCTLLWLSGQNNVHKT